MPSVNAHNPRCSVGSRVDRHVILTNKIADVDNVGRLYLDDGLLTPKADIPI